MPMCRPCSSGRPRTPAASRASTMSLETGHVGCVGSSFCSGPPRPNRPDADPDRDPVEHDRRDHLVGARRSPSARPAIARPQPRRAAQPPRMQSTMCRQRRHALERRADPDRQDRADDVLALAADVEQAAAERERHREAGEDQRRREDQRLLEVDRGDAAVVGATSTGRASSGRCRRRSPVGRDRVVARDQHDEPADEERDEHGDQRRDRRRRRAGSVDSRAGDRSRRAGRLVVGRPVAHAALAPRPPPVIATPKSSSEASRRQLGHDLAPRRSRARGR